MLSGKLLVVVELGDNVLPDAVGLAAAPQVLVICPSQAKQPVRAAASRLVDRRIQLAANHVVELHFLAEAVLPIKVGADVLTDDDNRPTKLLSLADAHMELALEKAFLSVACEHLDQTVEGFKKKHGGRRRTRRSS